MATHAANESASPTVRLEAHILERIPLARAMGLAVSRYSGDELEMTAPLGHNINDKGCAFGGSVVSLLTLAGWGLIELGLRARGIDCDIYVGDSEVCYLKPIWGELRGTARLANGESLDAMARALRDRGKGRAEVACEIAGEDGPAATLTARFVAKRRA